MELRQVHYFVVTAAELNFHRAAERLSISQPALSRQIAALEQGLGAQLLQRDKRRVTLTADGVAFLARAQALLAAAEEAERSVRHSNVDQRKIRLAIPLLATKGLRALIETFERSLPDARFEITESLNEERLDALLRGNVDAALLFAPSVRDPRVVTEVVLESELCVIVHSRHPLAGSAVIPMQILADHLILLPVDRDLPAFTEALTQWCRDAGFEPRFLRQESHFLVGLSFARMLADEQAVCFWPTDATARPADTVAISVRPAPRFAYALAWQRANSTPQLRALVEVVKRERAFRAVDPAASDQREAEAQSGIV